MNKLYEFTVRLCLRKHSDRASRVRATFQSGQALHSVFDSIGPQSGRLRNAWDCLCWSAVSVVLTRFLVTDTTVDSYTEQNVTSSNQHTTSAS